MKIVSKKSLEKVPTRNLSSLRQVCDEFGRQDLYGPLSKVLDINIKWLDRNLEPFLRKGRYEIAANVMLYESKIGRAREYFEKALRSAKPGSERRRNLSAVLSNLEIVSRIAKKSWELNGKYPPQDMKEAVEQVSRRDIRLGQAVFTKILVAIDGSKNAARANMIAVRLAMRDSAELILVSVISKPPSYLFAPIPGEPVRPMPLGDYYDYARRPAEKWISEAVSFAKTSRVSVSGFVLKASSSVVKSITDYANEHEVDLIVLGTRGLGGFDRLLLGSISSGVVTHANCSVLVVR